MSKQKIYDMSFSKIFPLYVAKIERKGRNVLELYSVIEWLTGYTKELLEDCLLYTSPSPRDLSTSRMPSSA